MLTTLPALPALAAPAPPAPQANAGGQSQTGTFARELERAQPKDEPPAPQANVSARKDPGTSPAAKAAHGGAAATHPTQARPAATAGRSRTEPPTGPRADIDEAVTAARDASSDEGLAAEDAASADLSSMLASLMPQAKLPAVATQGAAGTVVAAEARTLGARQRASAQGVDDQRPAATGQGMEAMAALQAGPGTVAHRATREDVAESAPAAAQLGADAALSALLPPPATAPPTPTPMRLDTALASPAPAAYAAQIAAPVGSPDFAPGLSAQLSVMLRDGLQEARLQLNPAEMGPITVQIQLDGQSAQVTLVAEQAPTRQALEQAMPTLASALREGGLTLTGGGVFEQAPPNTQHEQQHRQAQRDTAASRRGSGPPGGEDGDALAPPTISAARTGTRRGVLDLYA